MPAIRLSPSPGRGPRGGGLLRRSRAPGPITAGRKRAGPPGRGRPGAAARRTRRWTQDSEMCLLDWLQPQ
eukprot:764237-Hanusia_phi.AAC.2